MQIFVFLNESGQINKGNIQRMSNLKGKREMGKGRESKYPRANKLFLFNHLINKKVLIVMYKEVFCLSVKISLITKPMKVSI